MKIIIAGASAIGSHLARLLSRSNQDIVLIDEDADKLGDISSNYDLMTLVGEATNPKTLRSAGVSSANLFIAVTPDENVNTTCCVMAKAMGAQKTVAQIDRPEYMTNENKALFKRMGIGGAGRFALCALQRSAVASLRNRCDHVGGIRCAFDSHRVGEKTDRTGRHARDAGNRFFHTRAACSAAHACNLILLHLRSSIPSRSFHELLQRHNEFIDDCIITVSDIPDNAMPNVTCKQLSVEGVDRCACSRRLRQDIGTVRILLQHALQAADLPLNSIQAIQKLLPLFL